MLERGEEDGLLMAAAREAQPRPRDRKAGARRSRKVALDSGRAALQRSAGRGERCRDAEQGHEADTEPGGVSDAQAQDPPNRAGCAAAPLHVR
jgi:hypothetical protein